MKKALLVVLALVLVAALSVGLTMAYLTSQDSVTNTFTVGNVAITLDETDTDNDDNTSDNVTVGSITRDKANSYKLIPGKEYKKDPTIHVAAGSEECWLFVKVENGLAGAEADGDTTIASQLSDNNWTLVNGQTNIYAYNTKVSAGQDKVVFEKFKLAGNANVASYGSAKIKVTAYAVQADGFTTAADALVAAPFPTN